MSDEQSEAAAPESYEAAHERLQAVIDRLDSGEAGLRETQELCAEAKRLVEYCASELDAVARGLEELELDQLVERLEGGEPGSPAPDS